MTHMLVQAPALSAEGIQWIERLGALAILGWIVVWASKRLTDRLDANTTAINALAQSILTAQMAYQEQARQHAAELQRAVNVMDVTLRQLVNDVHNWSKGGNK